MQQTRHEPYRIREHGDGLVLESEIRDTWEPLYLFSTRPFPMIDRQVGSWYVSTYPESHFVTGLTVALVTDDARWNLRGRNLAIHDKGESERIRFDTAAQVVEALTDRFGIDLTGLGDVEARVNRGAGQLTTTSHGSSAASAIRPSRRAYRAVLPKSSIQLRARMVASHSRCSLVTPIAPCSWCAIVVTGSTARPTATFATVTA